MKNKETKTESIKIRLSLTDKTLIDKYCAENNLQAAVFIRETILKLIKESQ